MRARILRPALALLLLGVVATGQTHSLIFDSSDLDRSVSPCEDFYHYANGGWLSRNPVPPAYPDWGMADVLAERNRVLLREVLEAAAGNRHAPRGSNEQKVGDFYASCMDEPAIEAQGLRPLAFELKRIEKIKDQRGLQAVIARLHDVGINALFLSDSKQDAKNSADVILEVWQGGVGLPEGEFYFKDDSQTVRDEYVKHVTRMFELMGPGAAAAAAAQTVMRLETELAKGWMPRVERRNPQKVYNRMTLAEAQRLTPTFSWPDYLRGIGAPAKTDINVGQPEFFRNMDRLLAAVPLADWQTYLRWRLIGGTAASLGAKFADEDFNFKGRVLTGAKENLPRWQRCVRAAEQAVGEALGEVYVRRAFPPEAKARALAMVRNLQAALRDNVAALDWMSDATRREGLAKLDTLVNKIGYPDRWRDYSALRIDRGPYVINRLRADVFENRRDLAKIGRPLDKTEWLVSPPTVDAYYSRANNEIVFPAGILQPPYFDPRAEDAFNYGAMGAVIGHEMTHGFDDQGSQYDARGNLRNWWTEADLKNFRERAECIVQQFDAFVVEPGLHVTGRLVAGESIADLGGLVIAYAAFQKSLEGKPRPTAVDGFTPEQRFFLGYAHMWATNVRPEYARLQTKTNPHPLPKFRVNGSVANMPAFAQAFACQEGAAMARPAARRCQIW